MLLLAAIRLAKSLPMDKQDVVNLFVSSSELAIIDSHAPLEFWADIGGLLSPAPSFGLSD
jgi:hypothetical protein